MRFPDLIKKNCTFAPRSKRNAVMYQQSYNYKKRPVAVQTMNVLTAYFRNRLIISQLPPPHFFLATR